MFSSVLSASICGIESQLVHVEADVSDGLPDFSMVGYLTAQVREASERVKTALRNSGITLMPKRITVNLSPADIRKDGSGFDLPIAAAILAAYGILPADKLQHVMMAGELGLDGQVKGIQGVLPMVAAAKQGGCFTCIVPQANEQEGAAVAGIEIIGIIGLDEMLAWTKGSRAGRTVNSGIYSASVKPCRNEDFSDINGQEGLKRAAEVAAAGMHNLLMIGSPGSGKTMAAKRIASILPELNVRESLEVSKIYSVAGLLNHGVPLIQTRPFRAPHHTITPQALAGGGQTPRPGEVSLAHKGVLFLDELTEFKRATLEILRQPLEEHQITISRLHGNYLFPANFMLVAAMNPCSCGYYPDMNRCTCTSGEIHRYIRKISRPLLDRIDITIEAPPVGYQDLTAKRENETSVQIRERVIKALQIQNERYHNTAYSFNAELGAKGVGTFCRLHRAEEMMLKEAFTRLGLSARAYHRIIKVARTIADLAGAEHIGCDHIAEAICYRTLDQKFWV